MDANGADDGFGASRELFERVLSFLGGDDAAALTHAQLEDHIGVQGRDVLCQLFQDHLQLRCLREERRDDVVDAVGTPRRAVETDHERALTTVFGPVSVCRMAYRRRGQPNLHPADATLNLPVERHSHGLRRLAAIESAKGSFDDAAAAIVAATGARVGKRQVEDLARRAAVDFDDFYRSTARPSVDPGDVVVISADAKGIVMRPGSLRPATATAAQNANTKLSARLSKGEKRNRKRMATVGAVYHATPVPRSAEQIFSADNHTTPAPKAKGKWLTASVARDAAAVVADLFDEAQRRDPGHEHPWVALVDGNNHQIQRITAEASARDVDVPIVIDFVHVLEYIWSAAWSFFDEGDPAAQDWVRDKAVRVLQGQSSTVAASIRRKATRRGLTPSRRANADTCANYLLRKRAYLDYSAALANGWPIATGVIEGACRHLVKDRMDITGARWSVEGAEAVLQLRALRSNDDFDDYWRYHLAREHQRNHQSRYAHTVLAGTVLPGAA